MSSYYNFKKKILQKLADGADALVTNLARVYLYSQIIFSRISGGGAAQSRRKLRMKILCTQLKMDTVIENQNLQIPKNLKLLFQAEYLVIDIPRFK